MSGSLASETLARCPPRPYTTGRIQTSNTASPARARTLTKTDDSTTTRVLRDERYGRPAIYLAAHLISMTGWAAAMRRCPELPGTQRMPYFIGFAPTCVLVSVASCPIGFYLSGAFPPLLRLGFVFLTPVYFFVILIGDVRTRLAAVALACGALAGPLFHLVSAQWGILLSG